MTFEEYQNKAKETAIYPNKGNNYIYPTLGLAGEAGELANSVKKIFRDDNSILTEVRREKLGKELGDVLWYVATLASELKLNLQEIAKGNVARLSRRMKENKIHGDGSDR